MKVFINCKKYKSSKEANRVIFACCNYKKFDGNPLLVNHRTWNGMEIMEIILKKRT